MTRGEAYLFLLEHCKDNVIKYTQFHATSMVIYGANVDNELDMAHVNEMLNKKNKWEACVALLEEEKDFNMNMFGSDTQRDAVDKLFKMTPEELGQAAVYEYKEKPIHYCTPEELGIPEDKD